MTDLQARADRLFEAHEKTTSGEWVAEYAVVYSKLNGKEINILAPIQTEVNRVEQKANAAFVSIAHNDAIPLIRDLLKEVERLAAAISESVEAYSRDVIQVARQRNEASDMADKLRAHAEAMAKPKKNGMSRHEMCPNCEYIWGGEFGEDHHDSCPVGKYRADFPAKDEEMKG